jgi:phosphoribosylglycinamide formyltransferase 1
MRKKRIIVLFSGSASSLRYLFANDKNYGKLYEVVGGISNKKDTAGEAFCKKNGITFIEFNTKRFCIEHGYDGKLRDMPANIRRAYFKELVDIIGPFEPDLILLSGFMLEITEPLLGYLPIINVHPSDLRIKGSDGKPKYTGDDAVTLAINDGQQTTASTIHFVEEEVDCGEIICISKPLTVEEGATPKDHQERMKTLCDGPAYEEALRILCLN